MLVIRRPARAERLLAMRSREEIEAMLRSKLVLSADEVGLVLDTSPDTTRRILNAGELEGAFKAGREWRVPAATLRRRVLLDLEAA